MVFLRNYGLPLAEWAMSDKRTLYTFMQLTLQRNTETYNSRCYVYFIVIYISLDKVVR